MGGIALASVHQGARRGRGPLTGEVGLPRGPGAAVSSPTALQSRTTQKDRFFDIIGNRSSPSAGVYIRLPRTGVHESWPEGMLGASVDDAKNGHDKTLALARSAHFEGGKLVPGSSTGLNDGPWNIDQTPSLGVMKSLVGASPDAGPAKQFP